MTEKALGLRTGLRDAETRQAIADLPEPSRPVVVARGGKGGRGNAHFAPPTHRAPRHAEPGQPGEERWVALELRLIADVGLVGVPNVGKSTLLSRVSAAKPKIADYPFTTTQPALGVVRVPAGPCFAWADTPGLIEAPPRGGGLGHDFLRHISRTRVIIHVLDLASERDPLADFDAINEELRLYDAILLERPILVALNKIDVPEARARATEVAARLGGPGGRALPLSPRAGGGLPRPPGAGAGR